MLSLNERTSNGATGWSLLLLKRSLAMVVREGVDGPGDDPAGYSAAQLREAALELLGYPTVRESVARRAVFPPARDLALAMDPSNDEAEVAVLQTETSEGLRVLEELGDVDLMASDDASGSVTRAALEGMLTGKELLAVGRLLEVLRRAHSSFASVRSAAPTLSEMAEGIPELADVERRIRSSIDERGEVPDSATPSLGILRRQVRRAYEDVASALEGVIGSASGREALQDEVISMRSERLVVQVKAERRHRVPGVVHGASNTGATLFIEPFATVDLGNSWRELALEEERETLRVLRQLSGIVGSVAEEIAVGTEIVAYLDFVLARARYSYAAGGSVPAYPGVDTQSGPAAAVRLMGARHPLLGPGAVPISVSIGPDWTVLVITGPNTGGKTAAMKALGLLALMHQSGLQIPAEAGSILPVFDGVYADIGDLQSIEESVSTFGSHMRNVIRILSCATPRSLVLLDELGTSTDPEEGSALAKAILEHLAEAGVAAVATTHHKNVAAFAEVTAGMANASVELDAKTLRPTYHLTPGVPGRSYAMSVAEQMGLTEGIMERARELLEPQHLRFEDWLDELQGERQQIKEKLEAAVRAQVRAEEAEREIDGQRRELAERREEILQNMRGELAARFDETRRRLRRAEAALSWKAPVMPTMPSVPRTEPEQPIQSAPEAVETAATELEDAEKGLRDLEREEIAEFPAEPPEELSVGDLVHVRGLNVQGTVQVLPVGSGEAEVAIGSVRLRVDVARLSHASAPETPDEPEAEVVSIGYALGPAITSFELDLRGMRAEEALISVEDFLDRALRDGLSEVRIIHGKGTGVLRQAVRELLEHHPLAKSFRQETPDQGGSGATAVELT
jgi:DNA mismatch repair protein MutS2